MDEERGFRDPSKRGPDEADRRVGAPIRRSMDEDEGKEPPTLERAVTGRPVARSESAKWMFRVVLPLEVSSGGSVSNEGWGVNRGSGLEQGTSSNRARSEPSTTLPRLPRTFPGHRSVSHALATGRLEREGPSMRDGPVQDAFPPWCGAADLGPRAGEFPGSCPPPNGWIPRHSGRMGPRIGAEKLTDAGPGSKAGVEPPSTETGIRPAPGFLRGGERRGTGAARRRGRGPPRAPSGPVRRLRASAPLPHGIR